MSLLIESSVRAALLAGAVAAIVWALRVRDSRARHTAWCAVLGAMMLLPVWAAWGPVATLPVLPGSGGTAFPLGEPVTPPDPPPAASAPAPVMSAPAATLKPARLDVLWAAYLGVAGLLLLRLAYGAARASSIRRWARAEDGFLSSDECSCPVTVGLWRPAVILPATWRDWPRAELDAVLAHERAHVRRRDPLVQWLAAINRSIFWFHPLAWWLERRLAALAEEACDAAAVASGHDPHDYSEYLIHQARAVEQAGARLAIPGAAIGGGDLGRRIRVLLDARPAPALGRFRAIAAAALCLIAIAAFTACRLGERRADGQLTMHEQSAKVWESNRQYEERRKRITDRAAKLTPSEAEALFATFKQNPADEEAYWVLLRHYEAKQDVAALSALKLWIIENEPAGKLWSNIDPRHDRAAYEKGKALWLAHVEEPGAAPEVFERAAGFLQGVDKPLAESILESGRKAYPADNRWTDALARHYARTLVGADEPITEYNVARKVSAAEAGSPYAQQVRARLAESRDAALLAQTSVWVSRWGQRGGNEGAEFAQLAKSYLDRAASINPENRNVRAMAYRLAQTFRYQRYAEVRKMTPDQFAAIPIGDRLFHDLHLMREDAYRQDFSSASAKARALLTLASEHTTESIYGEVVFDANMILGKAALRGGDKKAAVRHLLAAADAPPSGRVRAGDFEMNLPRALVDWGERRAVVDFYQRLAPKSDRAKRFQDWAAELAKGINPDLIPTFSAPGCKNDPC